MVEMKLELVHLPVSDVDRAKAFNLEKCGWELLTVLGIATPLSSRFADPDGNSWLLRQ